MESFWVLGRTAGAPLSPPKYRQLQHPGEPKEGDWAPGSKRKGNGLLSGVAGGLLCASRHLKRLE